MKTDAGVDLTERRIRFAHRWFGVDVVVSSAGQPRDPDERAVTVANLRRLGDTAESLGMVVAIETHKGPTQNARAMLDLMTDVDHPAVRLNFDTGNIAYYNEGVDPADELEKVKHLVRNVHLKDNRGRPDDWYFPSLGDGGSVDFRRVRTILDGVAYTGPYTIELEGIAANPSPASRPVPTASAGASTTLSRADIATDRGPRSRFSRTRERKPENFPSGWR